MWCDKCFPARFSDLITSQSSSTSFCRLLFADSKNVLLYLSCSAHALLKSGLRVLNHAKVFGEKFLGLDQKIIENYDADVKFHVQVVRLRSICEGACKQWHELQLPPPLPKALSRRLPCRTKFKNHGRNTTSDSNF